MGWMPILFQNLSAVCLTLNPEYTIYQTTLLKNKKKAFLPQKNCIVCKRPFTWRKKWEKVWEDVKYCSDKCRMNRNKNE